MSKIRLSNAGRNLRTRGSHVAAQILGSEGGKSKSRPKALAARRNGKKNTGND